MYDGVRTVGLDERDVGYYFGIGCYLIWVLPVVGESGILPVDVQTNNHACDRFTAGFVGWNSCQRKKLTVGQPDERQCEICE